MNTYAVEVAGYLRLTFYVLRNGERISKAFNCYNDALSAKLDAKASDYPERDNWSSQMT